MFTRKHFREVAAILYDARDTTKHPAEDACLGRLRSAFADLFARSNPKFDRGKFLLACIFRDEESY